MSNNPLKQYAPGIPPELINKLLNETDDSFSGGGGAGSADELTYDNAESNLDAENAQDAIDETEGRLDTVEETITNISSDLSDHTGDTNNPHNVTKAQLSISDDPIAATAGLRTLGTGAQQAAAGNHVHAASAVTFTSNGDISASTVQAAIVEVRDDTDTKLAGKSDTSHVHTFASLTSKPTTLSGYSITDAMPLRPTIVTVNSGETASDAHHDTDRFCDTSGGAFAITINTGLTPGTSIRYYKDTNSVNDLTFTAGGGMTLRGGTTLSTAYGVVELRVKTSSVAYLIGDTV